MQKNLNKEKNVDSATAIISVSNEAVKFAPTGETVENAYIKSEDQYVGIYNDAKDNHDGFWAKKAEEYLVWDKKWDKITEGSFNTTTAVKYFPGGKLNPTKTCLEQHLKTWRRNKAALIWQGEPDDDVRIYTYQQLFYEVNKFANVLKKKSVKKGDTVILYMPLIPELIIAMLGCARIGAVHSVVFAGFSAAALRNRIQDCKAKYLVTSNVAYRRGRVIPLKNNTDDALNESPTIETVIVVKRKESEVNMELGRDYWWHEEMAARDVRPYCDAEIMDADDLLFILYTSGSTGKPKGLMHTIAGYLLYTALTLKWVFDVKDEDVWWCTADIGWITGHSYGVYGPLALGATSLIFEGAPDYPRPDRFWQIVEKYQVNQFYTSPTAIRALMRYEEEWVEKHDLSSLRILGTVGEPINPEAWRWYHKVVGKNRLPIMDTYWQTETGGFVITPLPGVTALKPGSATKAFPGIIPMVLTDDGKPASVNEGGHLVITHPWPGMCCGIYGNFERFKDVHFTKFPGCYYTGDSAKIDDDGYFWLMGRLDDVINISGHRLGTAEVESALVSHASVTEAAVVGVPHEIKGETIYAFVTLKKGIEPCDNLVKILKGHVRLEIGPIATPAAIQFATAMPKTRSGKIMRRILKRIAAGETAEFGDTSTLADASILDELINRRKQVTVDGTARQMD